MNEDGLILLEILCLYHNKLLQPNDVPLGLLYLNNLTHEETKDFLNSIPTPETIKPKIYAHYEHLSS